MHAQCKCGSFIKTRLGNVFFLYVGVRRGRGGWYRSNLCSSSVITLFISSLLSPQSMVLIACTSRHHCLLRRYQQRPELQLLTNCILRSSTCTSTFFLIFSHSQGVTKRFLLSWLTIAPSWGLRGLSQWVQLCTWSPNKLWRSNSIFNLWSFVTELRGRQLCFNKKSSY